MFRTLVAAAACTAGCAFAQTVDPCQGLAGRYAQDPAKLSDNELGQLRTCVTDLLKLRQQPQSIEPTRKSVPAASIAPPQDQKSKPKGVQG